MTRFINTAERVSKRDASDNFVFARSLLAYREAARLVGGNVLEVGTGNGYGAEVIAPAVEAFTTVDKHSPPEFVGKYPGVVFLRMEVPPLDFPSATFDFVISFQVIEHIEDDAGFLSEVRRVLKPGGKFIVTTPNAAMSLTRNPWHVREYTAGEFTRLLESLFGEVEALGVFGDERVMEYYRRNREGVRRITRFDIFDLQHRLPRRLLQIPYDIANRLNRRRLLAENTELTTGITPDDYRIAPVGDEAFDLFYVAAK